MKRTIHLWQWLGFIVTGILGVVLHYLYDWLGQNPLIALISAVNESTWEHMKLLFFPMFLFALLQAHFWKERPQNFWCIKLYGILIGLALIPIIFYTFNGVFGKSPDWYNITIFFQASAIAYLAETALFKSEKDGCCAAKLALIALLAIAALFAAFTFFPPNIPLFRDPITMQYGIIS
ncbi:MAG: hypothetical protein IJ995_02310 [Clostridia bacterium]|nr:hypothetical protein [Clostridia bacterium]